MDFVIAILLGVVQGLTEFLPVSSSGCLVILERWFGFTAPALPFHVFLHAGTTIAVMLVFRRDLIRLTAEAGRAVRSLHVSLKKKTGKEIPADKAGLRSPAVRTNYQRLFDMLVTASIPAVLLGALFHRLFASAAASPFMAGIGFLLTGVLLLVTDKVAPGDTIPREIPMKSAWQIGAAKAAALLPGVSGTAAALCTGIFAGFSRKNAIRFSFLLSVPVTAAALLFELAAGIAGMAGITGSVLTLRSVGLCLVGFAASAVTGVFAAGRLLRLLQNMRFLDGACISFILGMTAIVTAFIF
ncbi:MAG: undecaprenyl-diphosphate phosphatase [Lachnospiraceae bacterium]|nr:undecaprenyl-diphosphate phosphatase [Lachnospiraceae bacterium]